MNIEELMALVNTPLKHYEIVPTTTCVGEAGETIESDDLVGYSVVSRITGITEATGMSLVDCSWRASYMDNQLTTILNPSAVVHESDEFGYVTEDRIQ